MGPPPSGNGNEQMTDATKPFNNNASMREKEQVLRDTMHNRAQAKANEIRGRFAAHERSNIVGSTPSVVEYPAGPNWACDPVPQEPSLGFSVEDHEAVGEAHELLASC